MREVLHGEDEDDDGYNQRHCLNERVKSHNVEPLLHLVPLRGCTRAQSVSGDLKLGERACSSVSAYLYASSKRSPTGHAEVPNISQIPSDNGQGYVLYKLGHATFSCKNKSCLNTVQIVHRGQ